MRRKTGKNQGRTGERNAHARVEALEAWERFARVARQRQAEPERQALRAFFEQLAQARRTAPEPPQQARARVRQAWALLSEVGACLDVLPAGARPHLVQALGALALALGEIEGGDTATSSGQAYE